LWAVAREGLRELGMEAFRGLLWPSLSAAAWAGLLMLSTLATPVPLPYLMAAAAFGFGAVIWSAVHISLLQERRRVRDRLLFEDIWFGRDFVIDDDGNVNLTSVQIGLIMSNAAPFPMNIRVADIRSSFAGRIPQNPQYDTASGTIQIGRATSFRDASIHLGDGLPVTPGQAHQGWLHFKVEYDRDDRYRYAIEHKLRLSFYVDRADPTHLISSWNHTAPSGLGMN
jgi:hypothetical protein